jgi:hypothetical protein
MMDTYQKRREFSDKFLPEVKKLLGLTLIKDATQQEDKVEATDLVLPYARIAVRVRQKKWIHYSNEFTLRSYGPKHCATEYAKLLNNRIIHATYYLSCFVDEDGNIIKAWLIDLETWRDMVVRGDVKPIVFKNADKKSIVSFPCRSEYARLIVN